MKPVPTEMPVFRELAHQSAHIPQEQGPIKVNLKINVLGMLPVAAGMYQGQVGQKARPIAK